MESPMTKFELIELLNLSDDIPDDALVYAFDADSGRMERVTDFTYNAESNALELRTGE